MADINTVYSGLDKCRKCDCDDCVLFNASKAPWDCPAKDKLIDDAMELLKEYQEKQEGLPPAWQDRTQEHICQKCGGIVWQEDNYCSKCGQAVKWT